MANQIESDTLYLVRLDREQLFLFISELRAIFDVISGYNGPVESVQVRRGCVLHLGRNLSCSLDGQCTVSSDSFYEDT